MQKSNDRLIRKIPLPIDIEFVEGTSLSDGWHTITHKETSHLRIVSVDADGFLTYEITPPKKKLIRTELRIFAEARLIGTDQTMIGADGKAIGEYRYFKRPSGDYYACITGRKSGDPHSIELGSLEERSSAIAVVARTIVREFDVKKFSRVDLKPTIEASLTHGQKLKALLEILHIEGFLKKEIDQTSRNKAKVLYSATEKLKNLVVPSPSPEQA